jgi:hypothetical protein
MSYSSYQKFNTYGQLRSVMLGSYVYPEFFSKIKSASVREPLMRMAQEINEDLEVFEKTLKEYGCTVIRPDVPTGYFDSDNTFVPPLHVRNLHTVIGNTMYQLSPDFYNPVTPILEKYCSNVVNLVDQNDKFYSTSMSAAANNYNQEKDIWYSYEKFKELAGSSWPSYQDYVSGVRSDNLIISSELDSFQQVLEYETKEMGALQAPNVINTPHTIYVDASEYCDYSNWLAQHVNDTRPIRQFTSKASHVDGCFAVLGNNVILGIDNVIDYQKYFPNYHVVAIPPAEYQDLIDEFKIMKQKVNGSWWVAGEEGNDEFIQFVEGNLKSWVGYIAESVFDVNVLALDANTICVSNITPVVKEQLRQHNIECIVIPWRHRFFVDGGLHCITLDLFRDR